MCIVLQAVLLKCHKKLTLTLSSKLWPYTENYNKSREWPLFYETMVSCNWLYLWDNVPCLYTQSDRITAKALGSLKRVAKPSGACVEKLTKMFPASKTVPLKRPDVFDPLEDCVALSAQKKKKGSRVKFVNVKVIVIPKNASSAVPKGNKRQKLVDEKRVETIEMKLRTSSTISKSTS